MITDLINSLNEMNGLDTSLIPNELRLPEFKLFYEIMVHWNCYEDIEFELLNEDIFIEFLNKFEEYALKLDGNIVSPITPVLDMLSNLKSTGTSKRRIF